MHRVTCSFCGLPFSVRRVTPGADYFCCSGCALASRIPLGTSGQFPVSPGLVIALAFAFGLFNQALFGVLGGGVIAEGRIEVGARLQLVSLGIGGLLACVGAVFSVLTRSRSAGDLLLAPLVVAIALWFAWVGWRLEPGLVVWPLIAVNAVLAVWLARGWCWRALARHQAGR